jgi:hypothetical protein
LINLVKLCFAFFFKRAIILYSAFLSLGNAFLQNSNLFNLTNPLNFFGEEEVMSKEILPSKNILQLSILSASLCLALVNSCTVAAKNATETPNEKTGVESKYVAGKSDNVTKNSTSGARIKIMEGSPADTVRIFYKYLREKHFREAMMMTNLRPAVENLTESEMQDLNSDFEPLAQQVPEDLGINGEIITGNSATVTAKMPDEDTGKLELKEIQLRREKDSWVILTADEKAESAAKKEGKNYFFELRLDIHQVEAQNMMERIAKAQTVYALQNGGTFTDMATLINQGLLPEDAQQSKSTGYHFTISPAADKMKYVATAEPEVYGKTGKLSFLLVSDGSDRQARLKSDDNKGLPLKK